MGNVIVLGPDDNAVGSITFDQAPSDFMPRRTATGFSLVIPATVNLKFIGSKQPMLSNLRAVVFAKDRSGIETEIGRLESKFDYLAGNPDSSVSAQLIWRDILSGLVFYDKLRDGRQPQLEVEVHAEVCYIVSTEAGRFRTEPRRLFGRVQVSYPIEAWIRVLRALKVSENVLVEVPLPESPPAPWDGVWAALVEARDAFERGGETGWKGCVTGVRLALEEWRKIEEEDLGPGWKAPSREEREARSKQQRFDALRWHLLQGAHLAPHTPAEDWSRDDALLMLATLSALLAKRKP